MIASVHLEAVYAGQGFERPHHLFRGVVQIVNGVRKPYRDHAWCNAEYSNFPENVPHGAKVGFWASFFPRMGGQRLTDIREVRIIEEVQE
jgi:hypothetical protein